MLNIPPDVYRPNINLAIYYYLGAKELYTPQNRNPGFWIPAYYLISHALELCFKGYWEYENDADWIDNTHVLSVINSRITNLNLSATQVELLAEIDRLNSGRGGLRYHNNPNAEFLPNTFNGAVALFEHTVESIQNRYLIN